MNILRGDVARLQRCTAITTSSEEMISRWNYFVMQWLFVLCGQKQGNNKNMLFVSSVSIFKVQTVQVHIREGDSDVRLLQEA